MRLILLISPLLLITLLLGGCSSNATREPSESYSPAGRLQAVDDSAAIKSQLMAQHQAWRGTPYQYGGLSKRGIDCSGFVYLTYRDKFNINLPRSTEQQAAAGRTVSRNQLSTGDLVFFRTGIANLHVGIYIGKRNFLHASTSKGVMISSLDNTYWRSKYWKSQRI